MHLDRESGGDRGRGDTHQSMGKSMGRHIEFPAVYPPPRVLVTSANNYSVIHRGDIVINKLFDWLISWPRLFAYPLPPPFIQAEIFEVSNSFQRRTFLSYLILSFLEFAVNFYLATLFSFARNINDPGECIEVIVVRR